MKHFVDRLPAALSLVTLVLFCSVTGLQAQTFVEIGTNSISSSDQGPIYRASASSTLDYSRFSYLYTAGELGIPAGSVIDSIQFYKDNAGAISNPGNAAFDMYLNNVSATSFSSSQIWSSVITGATQVVDRDYVVDFPYPQIPGNIRNSVGWMTMTDALGASYGFFYTGGSLQLSTSWDCFPVANDPTDDGFLWWQDGSVTDKTVGNTGTTLAPPALDPTGTYAGRRPVVRVYYTAPAPVPDDAGVSSIDAPAPIVAPGLHDLEVSITNYGTNPLTTVNAYYSLNGGPAVGPLLWPGANLPLAPGASDGPVALDLLNILAGPNQVKVWTDAPNAGTDGNNYNDTAYIEITGCPGALAPGSYTIGAAGDYPTITAAYAALLTCGISGPVTFTALPGSGPYNERVTMTAVPGASSVNTITFDGNGETWSWSTGTSADRAACTIDGAQWITITNWVFDVGLTNTYGWGIHLWHAANNNRILSNTFNHDLTSSSTGQAAVVASNSQTSAASSGDNANYTLVEGNTMNGGYYGVAIYGSSSLQNVGNVVRNNTILDPYYYGVYMLYQSNGLIERNEVTKPLRSSPFSTTNYGIYVSNGQNLRCDGNRIHDLATSASTTTPSTYGIYYLSSDATPAEPNLIQNNLVYNLSPSNGTSGTYYGLYLSGSDYTHLYHNTVVENVPTNSSTSSTAGVYITSTDADGNEVSSNIVYVNRGGNATTNVALYYAETDPLHYPVVSDYNALFNASTEANAGIGRLGSTTYTPLANWNASTTFDPNSIEEDPVPVSLALGDLTPTNGNLDDAADPAILVALDYNGVARPLNTDPDPGAIEFEPANFDAAITWVSPMGASTAGNQTITVNIENSASSVTNITSVNLTYTDGVTPVTEPFGSLSIVPGANQDLVFTTPYNLTAATQMRA
ncbi:MAG: right-handed parallel beta-helix repeat-containing protein, partial [Flavobacteriales bacterium]|nr:right-handed parallel beta-helix repeat-containing protein [Flavobacteriales bacterium]